MGSIHRHPHHLRRFGLDGCSWRVGWSRYDDCWAHHLWNGYIDCLDVRSALSKVGISAIIGMILALIQNSEISPAKERGKYVVMNHIGLVAGLAVAFWYDRHLSLLDEANRSLEGGLRLFVLAHSARRLSRMETLDCSPIYSCSDFLHWGSVLPRIVCTEILTRADSRPD